MWIVDACVRMKRQIGLKIPKNYAGAVGMRVFFEWFCWRGLSWMDFARGFLGLKDIDVLRMSCYTRVQRLVFGKKRWHKCFHSSIHSPLHIPNSSFDVISHRLQNIKIVSLII
jgi:hypothetical protein